MDFLWWRIQQWHSEALASTEWICCWAPPPRTASSAALATSRFTSPSHLHQPIVSWIKQICIPSLSLHTIFKELSLTYPCSLGLSSLQRFEELQGRVDSKTAFYEALSNSLGGPEASAFVKEAASWFYSLHHTPSPAGYNVFSRALENATRWGAKESFTCVSPYYYDTDH